MSPRQRRRTLALALTGALVAVLATFPPHRVWSEDMVPSIQPGEWVVLGPVWGLQPGDVVLVKDPDEPGRRVLRRLIVEDQDLTVRGGLLEGGRYREMGRGEHLVVLNENDLYLVRTRAREFREPDLTVEGPGLVLLADDRDGPLDSRWWGAVPREQVSRRVWLRFGGPEDPWRSTLSWRVQDGPWIPPSRVPPTPAPPKG